MSYLYIQIDITLNFYRFIEDCDGFVYTSSDAYEPDAISATRQWLRESGNRPLYAIGPMLPPGNGQLPSNITLKLQRTEMSEERSPFNVNKILNTHGKNSLIYVSFPNQTNHLFTDFSRCPLGACGGPEGNMSRCWLKYC